MTAVDKNNKSYKKTNVRDIEICYEPLHKVQCAIAAKMIVLKMYLLYTHHVMKTL